MKKLFALLAFLVWATPSFAQAPVFCPTRPMGDNSNACASTAFVIANGGGGSASLVIGTSPITSGTANRLLYETGANVLGEITTGSGSTVLHGGAPPVFGAVVSADLNITTTTCPGGQFISAISATGVGTCGATAGGGTVTSVATTSPIGGGTIVGAGTITCTTCVTGSSLTSGSIVTGAGSQGVAVTTTGTGVVTALGVNVGTAGSFVVNGGALGSPSSAGTIPAFTLGGTITGGGNQINNVIIGTTTPLAGAFTSLAYSTTLTGTSTNAACLSVGPNGNTNPTLRAVCNTASANNGLSITSTNAAGVAFGVISGAASDNLTIDAKGSGTIGIGGTSTGALVLATGGGQVRLANCSSCVALAFPNDNVTGLGQRTSLEFSAYANSVEVQRWAQTQASFFATISAQSTLVSNSTRSIASAAGAQWQDFSVLGTVTTLTGNTHVTANFAKSAFFTPTVTSSVALTVDVASTVYIDGQPASSGSTTITNPYAFYVLSGASFFGGGVGIGVPASTNGTKWLGLAAGTTAYSQINFAASTAPTLPNDGDLWFETGSCLKLRVSGSNTSLCGGGASTAGQYTGGSLGAVIALSATTYVGPSDGSQSNSASATELDHQLAVPRAGTAKNLTVKTRAAQPGSGALVVTLRKNGVNTAVTLTISAGAAAGTFSDLSNTVAFAQLDLLSVGLANGATAAGPGLVFAVEYD